MKLYATTTSERASKGQGGNDQLEIDIFVYDRMNPRYHITVTKDEFIVTERGYNQERMFASHKDIREQEEKGEKKKDEKHYGQHMSNDRTSYCADCRKFE